MKRSSKRFFSEPLGRAKPFRATLFQAPDFSCGCDSSSSLKGQDASHAEERLPSRLPHGGALVPDPRAAAMNGGLAAAPPLISERRSLGDTLGLASGGSRPAPPAPVSRNPEAGGAVTKPFPAPESETGLSCDLVKRSSCGAMTHQTGIHGRKTGSPGRG